MTTTLPPPPDATTPPGATPGGVELVKAPPTTITTWPPTTLATTTPPPRRRWMFGRTVHHVTTLVRVVDLPPRTIATRGGRAAIRVAYTTWKGATSGPYRMYAAATHLYLREQVRIAHDAGDRESLAEWDTRLKNAKDGRVERLSAMPAVIKGFAYATAAMAGALFVVLVVGGLAVQLTPGGAGWVEWWAGVAAVVTTTGAVLEFLYLVGPWVVAPILLRAAYREGLRVAAPPMWMRTARDGDDLQIDETTIARALDALRITQISAYLKSGQPLQFLTTCRVDGRGTHFVIRLPAGVPAERIARRRADFATGLHRLAKEVWLKTGAEEGILDGWIADKGALAEGAGAYPLLDDGLVDLFKGVPFGKNLRGEPKLAPMMERNTIVGGMPGQGKSSAARVLMVGAALDPTAELRIWVPDSNFDFEAFRPRCSRYVMGNEHSDIEQILEDLRELHREVQARGALLVKYEIPAVTRAYASKNVGLHPLVCLLEECHLAFQHPVHGAEICRLYVDIVRLGRKRGIHMIPSTQAPTKDSIPRDITRNCSNGIAFAVGDHVANDALLGQGAYRAGHRATDLIPGTDRGTAVVKGFSGQRSEILQAYFLDIERGHDEVTPIILRALDAIDRAGRPIPGSGRRLAMEDRDLLADLDEVLGVEPLPIADVASLLHAHAPGYAPYRALTGKSLREQLQAAHGIKVPSTGNRWPLDPGQIREALAGRPDVVSELVVDLDEDLQEGDFEGDEGP